MTRELIFRNTARALGHLFIELPVHLLRYHVVQVKGAVEDAHEEVRECKMDQKKV